MTPRIEICSQQEAEAIIKRLTGSEEEARGIAFTGHIDAVCREAETGAVAWEVHKKNLVTNLAKRGRWPGTSFTSLYVVTSPSSETARADRTQHLDLGSGVTGQVSGAIASTLDAVTWTRSYTTSFAVPASARRVGLIGLADSATGWTAGNGVNGLIAYTLLTPYKTQGPTQTLEIVYKLTLNFVTY